MFSEVMHAFLSVWTDQFESPQSIATSVLDFLRVLLLASGSLFGLLGRSSDALLVLGHLSLESQFALKNCDLGLNLLDLGMVHLCRHGLAERIGLLALGC